MILMNDFKAEPEALRDAELAAAERVLRSGWFVLGNEVRAFEDAWAKQCNLPHAVGVGNGMDAIEIGLRAIGIGPGDEVITTAMTAFATVLAIFRAGATPVLADIDPRTALLDPSSVERCITARTKGVLVVHLYGQLRNLNSWVDFCDTHKIDLLEDCAQSHLAQWEGKTGGAFGRFGAYSFYPTKNLGAIGDAGAIVSGEASIADRARILRNYGQSERYYHPELGLNSRLDELQAALLLARAAWLNAFTQRRREIAATYYREIRNPRVRLLDAPVARENHVFHLFVVACERRDRLARFFEDRGIQTLVHYPVPVHHQRPCKEIRRDLRGMRASEQHAEQCLSIPCHPQMDDAAVGNVVEAINAFH